jgi:uncharacterized membrane protein
MGRTFTLVLSMVVVFAAVVAIMLKLMPQPLKDTDYLIVGTVATLVSLVALFVLLVVTGKASNVFFKRRQK